MKFSIDSNDFKDCVNRISNTVIKTSMLCYEYVKISANGSCVDFQAGNGKNFSTVTSYTNVYENGETWVELSDLKKTTNITGELTITAEDGRFEVRSAKKSYELTTADFKDTWIPFPMTMEFDYICNSTF